jgi:hypothetical protein
MSPPEQNESLFDENRPSEAIALLSELGLIFNAGNRAVAQVAALIELAGTERVRDALAVASARGIGMPAAVAYAAKVVQSASAEQPRSPRQMRIEEARRQQTQALQDVLSRFRKEQ